MIYIVLLLVREWVLMLNILLHATPHTFESDFDVIAIRVIGLNHAHDRIRVGVFEDLGRCLLLYLRLLVVEVVDSDLHHGWATSRGRAVILRVDGEVVARSWRTVVIKFPKTQDTVHAVRYFKTERLI